MRSDGDDVRLTPTEWHLVEILVRNPGKLVSQRQLLQEVWGPQYQDETNYLRVYMAQIRRKLEPDPAPPRYFITEPGMGYRFEAEGAPMNQTSSQTHASPAMRWRCVGTAALVADLASTFRDDIEPVSKGSCSWCLVVAVVAVGGSCRASWQPCSCFAVFNYFFLPPYDTFRSARRRCRRAVRVPGLAVLISVLIARADARARGGRGAEPRSSACNRT